MISVLTTLNSILPKRTWELSLGILDQAAYGASTYVVTVAVAHEASTHGLGQYLLVWGYGWLGSAVLSAAIVIPVRLRLAREEIRSEELYGLRIVSYYMTLAATLLSGLFIWLLPGLTADIFAAIAIALAGWAFALRRGAYYAQGEPHKATIMSVSNLLSTATMLGMLRLADASITDWGVFIGAAALLPAVALLKESRGSVIAGCGVLVQLRMESVWNGVNGLLNGVLFGVGMLTLVTRVRGFGDAGSLGHLLILVSPVQIVSQALPLMYLHRLIRAYSLGAGEFLAEWFLQLRMYMTASFVGFGVLYAMYPQWLHFVIGEMAKVPYVWVALCGISILFCAWSSSGIQAFVSAKYLPMGAAVSFCVVAISVLVGVSVHQLPYIQYAVAGATQCIIVLVMLKSKRESNSLDYS